jgi:hypothetical protein
MMERALFSSIVRFLLGPLNSDIFEAEKRKSSQVKVKCVSGPNNFELLNGQKPKSFQTVFFILSKGVGNNCMSWPADDNVN